MNSLFRQLIVLCVVAVNFVLPLNAQPQIHVTPDSLSVSLASGDTAVTSFSIHNAGPDTLTWSVSNFKNPLALSSIEAVAAELRQLAAFPVPTSSFSKRSVPASGGWTKESAVRIMKAPIQSPGSLNIAIVAADYPEFLTDVQTNLVATGYFSSVTIIDASSVTPTLAQLETFDAVLVWAGYGFADPLQLGNNLADYVDDGGGVVTAEYAMFPGTIGGRFATDSYWVFSPNYCNYGQAYLGAVYFPIHPVMNGVTSFDGGSTGARPAERNLVPGAVRIADWSDGAPLIAERIINGVGRIDLGFFPPSSQVSPDLWNISTDGAKILANSLRHVAHRFLTASPASGKLAGGASQTVALRVSAQHLMGGLYRNQILIASNDPAKPSLAVPVNASVTANPTIVVSPDTLKYGTGFLGYPDTLTLTIKNKGIDILHVSSMTSSNVQCSVVGSTILDISISDSQKVKVAYSRASLGSLSTSLTIASNDTNHSSYAVHLLGTTIPLPVIQVLPDSFQFAMQVGSVDSGIVTISNSGGSDLNWNSFVFTGTYALQQVEAVASAMRQRAVAPSQSEPTMKIPRVMSENSWTPTSAVKVFVSGKSSAAGLNVALLTADYSNYTDDVAAKLMSTGKFSTVTIIDGRSVTPTMGELFTYNSVLLWPNGQGFLNGTAIGNVLADYVDRGGGVVTAPQAEMYWLGRFTNENYFAIAANNTTSGISFLGTIYVKSHPIMNGVASFNGGLWGLRYTGDIAPGAIRIADWSDGNPLIVEKTINNVTRVDLGFYPPSSSVNPELWPDSTDGAKIMANALVYVGRKFVTVIPPDGTISAGSSQQVKILADAAKLTGGDFTNVVMFESNDPVTPHTGVRVRATTSGNPTIVLSPDTVDFGDGFPGVPDTSSLRITNNGTDTLRVTSMAIDNPAFALLDGGTFQLGPNQYRDFHIRYDHEVLGTSSAALTISNNDTNRLSAICVLKSTTSTPPISAGSALKTDGVSQYMEVPYSPAKPLFNLSSQFTIELWINPQSAGPLVSRKQCSVAYPSIELSLGGSAPSFDLNLQLGVGVNDYFVTGFSVSNIIPQNRWSHIATTYDPSTHKARLYVDGVIVQEGEYAYPQYSIGRPTTSLWLMGIPAPPDIWCWSSMTAGEIDEVRIWNKTRTQQEIISGMHTSYSAAEKNLVGYWRFDDSTGTSSTDNSGEGNTALLHNSPLWITSGALIHHGGTFAPGRLIVCADASPTSDVGYANAPTGSTSSFVANVDSLFANGSAGHFLIYSDHPAFGAQFRNTATSHGHIVDQSLSPTSFGQYDGIFVGGNISVNIDSLYNYIRHGGNVYLAAGALSDTAEEQFWNQLTMLFGIQLTPKTGLTPKVVTYFDSNPLFAGVSGLYTDNPSGMALMPGYLSRTKLLSSRGNENYLAIYDETMPSLLPGSPTLYSPANGSTFSAISQVFDYNYLPLYPYRFEIASDANFSTIFKDTILTSTHVVISNLSRNTTYYWRVSVINSAGQGKPSAVWSFKTIPDAVPGIPTLLSPIDSSKNVIVNPVLSWNTPIDVSVYQVQVSKDSLFGLLSINDSGFVETQRQLPQLEMNTKYYWRVRGINLVGEGGWSNVRSFTTEGLPDLQVTQVQLPVSAFSGQFLEIRWVVANKGVGPTTAPVWGDRLYLCLDSVFNPNFSIHLGDYQNPTYLDSGGSYSNSATVRLPNGISGTYYVFITTDIGNAIREYNENNNTTRNTTSFTINLTSPPDLQVVQVIVPSNTFSGQTVPVYWTVKNLGTGTTVTNSWRDAVYLSSDSILDIHTDRRLTTVINSTGLAPDSSYFASANVIIPYTVYGKQFIIVYTDNFNNEYEFASENNNTKVSDSIIVTLTPPADLVPLSITIPGSAGSGKNVLMNWAVQNQGASQTREYQWYDELYLCSSPTFIRDSSIALGSYYHIGNLSPESTYTVSHQITIPNAIQGSYYVYVDVNHGKDVFEYTYGNNNMLRSTNQIVVSLSPWPDLQVTSVSMPDTITAGYELSVNWTVKNNGTAKADQSYWNDYIYLSPNSTWDPQFATYMKTVEHHQALDTGAVYSQQTKITIPTNFVGVYYAYVVADANNQIYEYTSEGNNITHSNALHVGLYPPIDLALDSVNVPTTGSSGQNIDITWRVKNIGEGRTIVGTWEDALYLSTDTLLSTNSDLHLAQVTRNGPLAGGSSYQRSITVKLPNDISGDYYLFATTDLGNQSADINLGNNIKSSSTPLTISLTPSPDLAVTSAGVISNGVIGQPITVYWSVQNNGTGTTPNDWYDAVYLSTDSILHGGEIYLGTYYQRSPFNPSVSYTDTFHTYIPIVAPGSYYVIVKTDNRDDLYEGGSEANNVKAVPVTLTSPPPSDLVVHRIDFADSASVGDVTEVGWILRNQGTYLAVGTITDAVYISADSLWDIDDPLLGTDVHVVFLIPGASTNLSMKSKISQAVLTDSIGNIRRDLPGIRPGNYYIIVRTDIRNNIIESDETNNTLVSVAKLKVIVPEIQLGIPVSNAFPGGEVQYYRVNVPAGEVLRIALKSNNTTASNELFVKYGSVPSRRDFDFTYDRPFESDQTITVPETQEGTYYIFARCDKVNGLQQDTILASIIDYNVSNISPSKAGNTGQVTLKIQGAKLNSNAFFFLQAAGDTSSSSRIDAIRSQAINQTVAYATFDLTGKKPGLYDVYAQDEMIWAAADFSDTNNITYSVQTWKKGASSAGSFQIVAGGEPHLLVKLITPTEVKNSSNFIVTIDVFNAGNVDAKAPVVLVHNSANMPINMKLPINPDAPSTRRLLVLGPGHWRDIFAPGERTTIRLFARASGAGTLRFTIEDRSSSDAVPIDWNTYEQEYRDSSTAEQWAATWANFKMLAGSTFGELHDVIRHLAINRGPTSDEQYYFTSELLMELLGYAQTGIHELPWTNQNPSNAANNFHVVCQRTLDSMQTVQKQKLKNKNEVSSNLRYCIGELEYFWDEYNNDRIDHDIKWCGPCRYINSTFCLAPDLPPLITGVTAAATLLSIGTWRGYVAESPARYFLNLGDIQWDPTDQISIDVLNSPEVQVRYGIIRTRAIQAIEQFVRTSTSNCGAGNYDIEQFVPASFRNSGMDFGGNGTASGAALQFTIGGISPHFTGDVNIRKTESLPNGASRLKIAINQHLKIHDRYDFCPASGVGSWLPFDFVFFQLRQMEQCGLTFPYYHDIDVDLPPIIGYIDCGGSNSGGGWTDARDRDDGPRQPEAPPDPDPDDHDINVIHPSDPNDIAGPSGYGDDKWVSVNQPLSYTIHYENDPKKATAPAQVVTINLDLDSTLDARSFRVGEFGFGSMIFSVPENRSYISQRLDVRDSLGLYVDVNAGIDITTNKAFWVFRSIDPATGETPLNPILGYLLVNDSLHHGEGFVTYSVKLKKNSKTRDIAHAQGHILFDQESPLDTPPFFNTIDAGAPSSKVNASAVKIDSVTYHISWLGKDDSTGSGIKSYSVYVSKDGEAFNLMLSDVKDTSAVFTGVWGSTYKFFSIAQDYAGNIEPMKTTADATLVITDIKEITAELPKEFALAQNYPNPFNPTTTFRYNLPVQSQVTLIIYDVLGREVKRLVDDVQDAGFKSIQWNSISDVGYSVATGVYFYRLEANNISDLNKRFTQVKKMILLK